MEPTHTHFILQPGKTNCQTSVTTSDSGMWAYAEHEKAIRELARLFIGSYPAGIVYADRTRNKGGDYARAAFLPYDTLKLDIEADCPADLAERIQKHACGYKQGDGYKIATCGPEITLGSKV